jgi:membrane associated rhomboid family serine protease
LIPVNDDSPNRGFPIVTIGIIFVNLLVFWYEATLGDGVQQFVEAAGVVPAEYACRCDLPPAHAGPFWITLLTSMWLHGSWIHLGGNMLYLWVFGDNVEGAFGSIGYIAFYLASGVVAGIAQILAGPHSMVPAVGASGAIAGVLAAYVVLFPTAQIRTFLNIGPIITMLRVPALVIIGGWFLLQFVTGVSSIADTSGDSGGIAYWAHIGGFVFGLLVTPFFASRARRIAASA